MSTQTLTTKHDRIGKELKKDSRPKKIIPNIYPHIVCNPKVLGGKPIILGTRISVATIAGYYQLGMSVDEILIALQHLSPAQIHSALAYYFEHLDEIDLQIADEKNVELWKKQVHPHPNAMVM
ncbi:MAG: DUF433 domain-containing protein [Ignavibacteriales bacterium]|nr:DUF433 domain-containing protein [Ignavibacteriales bacterium]